MKESNNYSKLKILGALVIVTAFASSTFSLWRKVSDLEKSRADIIVEYNELKNQSLNDVAVDIKLPPIIYGALNKELNIYFDNIIDKKDELFEYEIDCEIGGQYENYYRVIPTRGG